MELDTKLVIIALQAAALVAVVSYFGYKIKQLKKAKPGIKKLDYDEARELCRNMLHKRYHGQRGFIAPYIKEFESPLNKETMRKVLQKKNPVPNRHYLQTVLNDIAPGKYEVLPPPSQVQEAVA